MPLLEVSGTAADHLYREGSAKASFWEVIFGSGLRAQRRARVIALDDGTRMFDIPLLELERDLLSRAQAWLNTREPKSQIRETATLIAAQGVRVRLIGLQPCGQAAAAFTLRFDPRADAMLPPQAAEGLRLWFAAEGSRIATEALVPFGFTPRSI